MTILTAAKLLILWAAIVVYCFVTDEWDDGSDSEDFD